MDFLAVEKLPDLKTGDRSDPDEQVIYVNELNSLSLQNREKFHLLAQLIHKAFKAVAEEKDEEKALAEFIKEQGTTHDSLMERFDMVKQRHQVLTKLEEESDEITK